MQPNTKDIVKDFDKCASYSVLSMLAMSTIRSIKRFDDVDDTVIITKIYNSIKKHAINGQPKA